MGGLIDGESSLAANITCPFPGGLEVVLERFLHMGEDC